MTTERVIPSGAYRITDSTEDGYLFTRLYMDYTKREAQRLFRAELREANAR
jgi:hypothetical protein